MQELADAVYAFSNEMCGLYEMINNYIEGYGLLLLSEEEYENVKDYAIHKLVDMMNDEESD